MNFNFGEVLTKAWQIIWKHKVLWIFGILAGCGQGSGGGNSGGGGNTGFDTPYRNLSPQMEQWSQWAVENMATFTFLLCAFVLIIWLVTKALGAIGKTGLIRGTSQVENGEGSLIFGQLFSESIPYFWRMLVLSVIPGLPYLIPIFAIIVAAVMTLLGPNVSDGGILPGLSLLTTVGPLAVVCACMLVPVVIVFTIIVYQSERAVVLEDLRFLPALSRGWEVFRANLGPIIVMAIILAIIGVVAGLIISVPVLLVVFPTVFAFAMGQGETYSPLIFMGICLCIYVPVALVLQGIMTAYIESAWTITYMRITQPQQDNTPLVLETDA